ncbi:hypothetical protein M5689_004730 [Euphorbia peplus]|nr:hypothetical protein M5689_004730 [Euphorbia peplus]
MSKLDEGEANFGYWFRWEVTVCGFMIIAPILASIYIIKNAKTGPLFLDHLWKPCWKFLSPIWLLCYRVCALVCLAPFLYQIIAIDGAFAFYFYTQWTYALVMLYFALASVTSAYGVWFASNLRAHENDELLRRDVEDNAVANAATYREINENIKLQSHYAQEAIRLRAGVWGYLMQIVYQTCAGAVILTDVVFWCILVPFDSNTPLGPLMVCMHTLNAVFLVLDTALNNLPFPWFRLAYFVQWSCLYIVFQWAAHAWGMTWWPYPFLELGTPWAPFWYFALAVVHLPCYGIYVLIVKAKNSSFHHAFLRQH